MVGAEALVQALLPRSPAREVDGGDGVLAREAGDDMLALAGVPPVVGAAVAVTWFAPASSSSPTALCIATDGRPIARLGVDAVSVEAVARGTTIEPCP